jgi:hypothetical protein
MLVGYVHVSIGDQNLALQEDALKAAGCERSFYDEVSGAKSERHTGLPYFRRYQLDILTYSKEKHKFNIYLQRSGLCP